jgi:hypothetical protein
VTRAAAALLLAALLAGCGLFGGGGPPGPAADPRYGISVVDDDAVVEFYERASFFYDRLRLRRVNTLATYRDEVLRDFFRTDSAFADYYADLAETLDEAHFERNRPLALAVVEFRLRGPGVAEVVTRIEGDNGLPLRWWGTSLERVDRWERIQGRWWIVPRKL